jgi:formate--tetrahydrofolate ligase
VLIVTSAALEINGWENVERHLDNLHRFGQTVIVCLNKFPHDTEEKIAEIRSHIEALGVPFAVNRSYAEGGAGAEEFAQTVINTIEATEKKPLNFAYADTDGVKEKIEKICRDMYGAAEVTYSDEANAAIEAAYAMNQQHFPICIAKTQYSFSTDSKVTGAPTGHTVHIRNIVINSGAEMIVAVAGAIMRMPGLSKSPQAERIDIVNGLIEGLS